MYQEKYWKELYQLKVHLNYLEIYLQRSDFIDRVIKITLAISSSGSIAGWAIWKDYAFLWAFFIAASQVISVINNYLPYKGRIKGLSGLVYEFENLVHDFEKKWFEVSEGKLTNREINDLQFELRRKKTNILKKHLVSNVLPQKKGLLSKAQKSADVYFDNFY